MMFCSVLESFFSIDFEEVVFGTFLLSFFYFFALEGLTFSFFGDMSSSESKMDTDSSDYCTFFLYLLIVMTHCGL